MTKIVFFLVVFCICIILLNNLVAAGSCLSSGTERAATSAGISAKNMRVAENHCNGYDQAGCGTESCLISGWVTIPCIWDDDEGKCIPQWPKKD
ncbi:hypothetical protein GPALN_010168 [Globodera pallida]|nr:hypothetical protein GPALN_010168 [Globodera pallida]